MASAPHVTGKGLQLSRAAWVVLLAGVAVRESLSFWTGHPFDFEVWIRAGFAVAHGSNPYAPGLPPVPGISIAYTGQLLAPPAYLPAWPGLVGGIYRGWESTGTNNRYLLYLMIKQPPILGDLVSAYLIYQLIGRWSGSLRAAFRGMTFWSFFPYAIAVGAIWGQFDSLLVVIILGLVWVRDPLTFNLVAGVGIFVKWVSAIYLPFEFFRERGARRLLVILGAALPILLTLAAFAIAGSDVSVLQDTTVGQSTGRGNGMNYAMFLSRPSVAAVLIKVPDFYVVLPYLWVLAVVVGGWVAARWLVPGDHGSELRAMLWITALFLMLRFGLGEQYMLYLFALLVVDIHAFHPGRKALFWVTVGLTSAFLVVNNDLGVRFLAPVNPAFWTYAMQVDGSPVLGSLRTDVLYVLAALISVVLVQWVIELYTNNPHPIPFRWPRRPASTESFHHATEPTSARAPE
jgi:hypothetical protein